MNKKLVALVTALTVAILPVATANPASAGGRSFTVAVGFYCC